MPARAFVSGDRRIYMGYVLGRSVLDHEALARAIVRVTIDPRQPDGFRAEFAFPKSPGLLGLDHRSWLDRIRGGIDEETIFHDGVDFTGDEFTLEFGDSETPLTLVDDSPSSAEIVARCNLLAIEFYRMQGYHVPADYKMYEATHPAEVGVWNLAAHAFESLLDTDVMDALSDLEDEEDE
jgi:hypothetical protein